MFILKRLNLLIYITALMIFASLFSFSVGAESGVEIASQAAVLMDAETGQILYQKNMHERYYPASITKIMTALLALENAEVTEEVTCSDYAVLSLPVGTSHIALTGGEKLPLDEALYALMLPSANDAANVIAEHIAGSIVSFVEMMNTRARELGAKNTTFVNAHGLSDDGHMTTAYDMALITRAAIGTEGFLNYFTAKRHTMPATNKQPETRTWNSQHNMLTTSTAKYFYEYAVGGKLGWTTKSLNTVVTLGEKDGRRLICVIMRSQNSVDKYGDTKRLLEYGFNEFTKVTIPAAQLPSRSAESASGTLYLAAENDFTYLIHNSITEDDVTVSESFPDTIEESSTATISFSVKTENAEKLPMYAEIATLTLSASFTPAPTLAPSATPSPVPTPEPVPLTAGLVFKWIGISIVVFILLCFIVMLIIREINLEKKRKRERLRREKLRRQREMERMNRHPQSVPTTKEDEILRSLRRNRFK